MFMRRHARSRNAAEKHNPEVFSNENVLRNLGAKGLSGARKVSRLRLVVESCLASSRRTWLGVSMSDGKVSRKRSKGATCTRRPRASTKSRRQGHTPAGNGEAHAENHRSKAYSGPSKIVIAAWRGKGRTHSARESTKVVIKETCRLKGEWKRMSRRRREAQRQQESAKSSLQELTLTWEGCNLKENLEMSKSRSKSTAKVRQSSQQCRPRRSDAVE